MREFNYKRIIVHGSKFHADDVMCVALAIELNEEIEIARVNVITDEMRNDPEIIICDIGGGEFDHHQPDAEMRDEDHKHAACGLLFREFGEKLFPTLEYANKFRDKYIIPIEDADNGYTMNPLSSAIGSFNPDWSTSSDVQLTNSAFMSAVNWVVTIIDNEMYQAESTYRAEKMVAELSETPADADNGLAILDCYLPSQLFIKTDVKLTISPSMRGGYQLLTIKTGDDTFEDKLSLPESWLENKPKGCTFVHQARFIASFDTKENAIAAAKSIL